METILIPIELLKPNTWNPNRMSPKVWDALYQSATEFTLNIDPVTVREHNGHYQIIDGEHRYKMAQELGVKEINCTVIDVNDTQAKRLTYILNRTRGEDDPSHLKELLDSLLVELSPDELINGMAIANEQELNELLDGLQSQIDEELGLGSENEGNTKEIDVNDFEFEHKCPKCGFEF